MKINRGPVALVVLALAAELAYIAIKGSKEVAPALKKKEQEECAGKEKRE